VSLGHAPFDAIGLNFVGQPGLEPIFDTLVVEVHRFEDVAVARKNLVVLVHAFLQNDGDNPHPRPLSPRERGE
jgi:hypothetical protein